MPDAVASPEQSELEKILSGVRIPPQPRVLIELSTESAKADPDPQVFIKLITRDVGLSAAVLKTVNSPIYGLSRRIDSVHQATMLLGLKTLRNLLTGMVLKETLSGKSSISMERFWESASDIANISMWLAKRFYLQNPDECYTLGLFHDCGIPIMAQKFPDYKEVLMKGNSAFEKSLTEVEDAHYSTNHAVVGYYTCKSWNINEITTHIVRDHHCLDELFLSGSENIQRNQMMAILKMAGHLSHTFRRANSDYEWERIDKIILEFLNLSEDEFEELREDVHEVLQR